MWELSFSSVLDLFHFVLLNFFSYTYFLKLARQSLATEYWRANFVLLGTKLCLIWEPSTFLWKGEHS